MNMRVATPIIVLIRFLPLSNKLVMTLIGGDLITSTRQMCYSYPKAKYQVLIITKTKKKKFSIFRFWRKNYIKL